MGRRSLPGLIRWSHRRLGPPLRGIRLTLFYLCAFAVVAGVLLAEDPDRASRTVAGGALLAFFLTALPVLRLQGRLLVLAALIMGHLLLFRYHPALQGPGSTAAEGVRAWAEAATNGAGFAVLFAGIPFATIFIRPGAVTPTAGAPRTRQPVGLLSVAATLFILCIALSIGALWVTRPLYDRLSVRPGSRYRSVSAAYSGNVSVSPLDAVVNMTLVLAGISYGAYLPYGLLLFALILAVTGLFELTTRRGAGDRAPGATAGTTAAFRGGFLRTVLVVVLVVAGKAALSLANEVVETGLVLAGVSLLLIAATGGPAAVFRALQEHPVRLSQFVPVLAMIAVALFLAATLAGTPLAELVNDAAARAARLPLVLSALAIIALVAVLAFLGVHMFLTVGSIGALLSPASLGLSAPAFGMLLVLSYLVAMNTSPLVPFTIASAELNRGSGSLTAVRYQAPVWAVIALLGSLILSVV